MTQSDDTKRWAKEARSHRQALKKAAPPQGANLFMARLSRQQGVSRPPTRTPWFILIFLVLSAFAVYWAYSRYYVASGFVASSETPAAVETHTDVSLPLASTATVIAPPVVPTATVAPVASTPRVVPPDVREWTGPISAIQETRAILIQGRTRWKALWTEMGNTDEAPRVDFADYVVVGAFAGPRTPGSEVVIAEPQEREKTISIAYRIAEAQTAPGAALEPIYPYHIKIVVRSEKPVRFILDPKKP